MWFSVGCKHYLGTHIVLLQIHIRLRGGVENIHPLGCSKLDEICKRLHAKDWYIRR